jgi:hypothetical protein
MPRRQRVDPLQDLSGGRRIVEDRGGYSQVKFPLPKFMKRLIFKVEVFLVRNVHFKNLLYWHSWRNWHWQLELSLLTFIKRLTFTCEVYFTNIHEDWHSKLKFFTKVHVHRWITWTRFRLNIFLKAIDTKNSVKSSWTLSCILNPCASIKLYFQMNIGKTGSGPH